MKNSLYKFLVIPVLCSYTLVLAQEIPVNYSTIAYSGDTLKLKLNDDAEAVQWQQSTDGLSWTDISGANEQTTLVVPVANTYYRAHMSTSECGDTYSDTMYFTLFQNETDTLNELEVRALRYNCYMPLYVVYGKEAGYDLYESGTDIYTYASQSSIQNFSSYLSSWSASAETDLQLIWCELYRGIVNCNGMIAGIDETSLSADLKTQYKAEAYFLRAYYHWLIVETWGEVGMITEEGPLESGEIIQSTKSDFYTQIINDLILAESNLPETTEWGKANKSVVDAFLARVYLFNKSYSNALNYSQLVINSGKYSLLTNYDDLWDIHNQQNDEIIFAVNSSLNPDAMVDYYDKYGEGNLDPYSFSIEYSGHHGHLMFETRYDYYMPGMQRDVQNGRPFRRYLPTRYLLKLYEPETDQRFYGTFKTVWYCNNESSVPSWPSTFTMYNDSSTVDVDPAKIGQPRFALGDTSFVLIPSETTTRIRAIEGGSHDYPFDTVSGYSIYTLDHFYEPDGTQTSLFYRDIFFPITKKLGDTTRADMYAYYSQRDAMIIRLAEMYLIAAEAQFNNGDFTDAYNYFLMLANARATDGNGAALLSAYGINSGSDITIDFILEERARELAAEQHRWLDLKRTDKLVENLQNFNPDASPNIQEYHNLRPIPQYVLDVNRYLPPGTGQNSGY